MCAREQTDPSLTRPTMTPNHRYFEKVRQNGHTLAQVNLLAATAVGRSGVQNIAEAGERDTSRKRQACIDGEKGGNADSTKN